MSSEKWTLAEGIEKLFASIEDESGVDDLSTYERHLTLDISFAVTDEIDEINGIKIEPTRGINIILTADNPSYEEDGECWMFSRTILPMEGETLPSLVQRIAIGLEVKPEERIWEDGQS